MGRRSGFGVLKLEVYERSYCFDRLKQEKPRLLCVEARYKDSSGVVSLASQSAGFLGLTARYPRYVVESKGHDCSLEEQDGYVLQKGLRSTEYSRKPTGLTLSWFE
jgi:hypothetical protein